MMLFLKSSCNILILLLLCCTKAPNEATVSSDTSQRPNDNTSVIPASGAIVPYTSNPYYWQYEDQPVLLLGGSKDDNLFQIPHLKAHLDLMKEVGANYIRNTMSSRDEGNVKAFKKLSNGDYDLNQWNNEYWQRFEQMLKWTAERDIFVQIELWDQWDYNEGRWDSNPWNPQRNVNYSTSNTQLEGSGHYSKVLHDTDRQLDFFLTVPKVHNDEIVLMYQKKFIDKVLSVSLQYDHVLYTITNELFNQHPPEWSLFWMNYVKKNAQKVQTPVQLTEMFQQADITGKKHRMAFDEAGRFDFIDLSQNASQLDQLHWDRLQWAREYIANTPRPINHTKTYGSDQVGWTDGASQGIERFWRNIIGGAASSRFHRPDAGIGLDTKAQTQIRSARLLLSDFDIFRARPDAHSAKLSSRSSDEAYLSYISGKQYVVYFPEGGSIKLDLTDIEGSFELKWLDINSSSWSDSVGLAGAKKVVLDTPDKSSWVGLVTLKK